jgi:hypothetical protein
VPSAGFIERGLNGLPGGEESVLVNGVRAWSAAVWPGYDDIAECGFEKTDDAVLARELAEPTPVNKSPDRQSSSSGGVAVVLSSAAKASLV